MDSQEQGGLEEPKLVGGIPLNFEEISKKPGGKATVKGLSGQLIDVSVGPKNIDIDPRVNLDIHFYASIITDENQKNYLSFTIQTRGYGAKKQFEDFYAKAIADEVISYFEKKFEISGIMFDWRSYSDNYKKYFDLKKEFLSELKAQGKNDTESEEFTKQKAALGTWTGRRLAQPHGFTKVEVSEKEEVTDPKAEPEMVVRGKFYK